MVSVAADELVRFGCSLFRWYRRYWVRNYEASNQPT